MARIFLSYSSHNLALARDIEKRLKADGHVIQVPVGTLPVGKWRHRLASALRRADVFVALLSNEGLQSPWVTSEVGAARVHDDTRGLLVIPVLVGAIPRVPDFVSDYACFFLKREDARSRADVVHQVDAAIAQHGREAPTTPRIFISHRHKDVTQVKALIALLEARFRIVSSDIRCTSVPPYKLGAGERTSERLRAEIANAEVVLGLLSPDTSESKYVLAELGAAWGSGVPTFPLRIQGARFEDVPEPLNERHSLALDRTAECLQLVEDIARVTTLASRPGFRARVEAKARLLAKRCTAEEGLAPSLRGSRRPPG